MLWEHGPQEPGSGQQQDTDGKTIWNRISGTCQWFCNAIIVFILTVTRAAGQKCLRRLNHRRPSSQSEQTLCTRYASTDPNFSAYTGLLRKGNNRDAQIAQTTPEGQPQVYVAPEQRDHPRLPRSVQVVYLKPLKRRAQYGVPTCDLQLRSYSVRNVEFFADFALRAAYYLNLPAGGPIPLPRITERWTVPRSNFIFKKSQENFERITLRRLIQIQDGHPETVEVWLAFLRKHAYYGVGMKANVWQHEKLGRCRALPRMVLMLKSILGVGKTMDVSLENLKLAMEPKWAHFGRRKNLETSERAFEMMRGETLQRTGDTPPSNAWMLLSWTSCLLLQSFKRARTGVIWSTIGRRFLRRMARYGQKKGLTCKKYIESNQARGRSSQTKAFIQYCLWQSMKLVK